MSPDFLTAGSMPDFQLQFNIPLKVGNALIASVRKFVCKQASELLAAL